MEESKDCYMDVDVDVDIPEEKKNGEEKGETYSEKKNRRSLGIGFGQHFGIVI